MPLINHVYMNGFSLKKVGHKPVNSMLDRTTTDYQLLENSDEGSFVIC